jgi:hypothetical protein
VESLVDTVEVAQPGRPAAFEVAAPADAPTPKDAPAANPPVRSPEPAPMDGLGTKPSQPAANPSSGAIDPIPDDWSGDEAAGAAPRFLGAAAVAIGGYRFLRTPPGRKRRRKALFDVARF